MCNNGGMPGPTPPPPTQPQPRLIRVFVSSTFKDMQVERDELVKFIFPQLRKVCEQRGVTWGEVDLRWGITDEQKAEGRVLPICLSEIQRCRPYFIGVLGERYGWVPGGISLELIEREPWLKEHFDHSVTELEILHGVLNNPRMAEHAFFYFRDPMYLETLPPEQRSEFLESDSSQGKQKLANLKERIRKSGLPVHENYQNPKEFGQMVLKDLTAIIDRLYPEGSQPDPLDREAAEHEIFAHSRAQVHIGRQAYFDRLDAHARSKGEPLVILGESGSGKSALLANWAIRYRKEHPDELVLMHFIGATPGSTDWAAMLRRILGEIKRKCDIREEIPDKPEALRGAFANWLNMAAAWGKVVLILDALNQLEDREGAPDLVWLPPHIPENVRMFLSTLPGRPLDELKQRGWPALTIEPLQPDERKQLIKEYLALFTKALDMNQTERIASAGQCQNPLFLRVLLDELRLYGRHEQLSERIEACLAAPSIPGLYQLILERCEQDYERERPGLVRDSMSLLWAARRGLSETELTDLLGTGGQPLPRLHWSLLYLAMEQSFLSRGGLIGFAHAYLRQAVRDRYLSERDAQDSAHLRLAGYFSRRELNRREIDELPWQLAQAGAWQRLHDLLAYLPFFSAAWMINPFDVKAFWAQIENASDLRLIDAYRKVLEVPGEYQGYVKEISMLLADMGYSAASLSLGEYLIGYYRRNGDRVNLQACLTDQGHILYTRGDLDQAMRLHKEAEQICRELGRMDWLAAPLINQANILQVRGDMDEALALQKQGEQIFRKTGDNFGLAISLGNQANILYALGDLEGAMNLHRQAERLCRATGDQDGLQRHLINQALILKVHGDLEGAMALYQEAERICRALGNRAGLLRSLGSQGLLLYARGDLDGAEVLFKEEENFCRELENRDGLQAALGHQAMVLYTRGELEQARALYQQQEQICREVGDKNGLEISLDGQAIIQHVRGDLEGAMVLYREAERLCRELGNKEELRIILGSQGLILNARGDLDGAMQLFKAEEQLCRELGNQDGLAVTFNQQALTLKDRGDLDGAMALLKETDRICRITGNKDELRCSLGAQALILNDRGDLDGALKLHAEEAQLSRELGNRLGLQISLGNQAGIYYTRGQLDRALELYKEEEGLCRAMGKKDGLAISLKGQALVLKDRGDLDGALKLFQEEAQLRGELGNRDGLQISLGNQANIYFARAEFDAAMACYREQEQLCREKGHMEGLAISLINQALTLGTQLNQPGQAIPLAEEAYRLASEHGFASLALQITEIRMQIQDRLK
jgi:tetratricopeptide (TPR) repeat protein